MRKTPLALLVLAALTAAVMVVGCGSAHAAVSPTDLEPQRTEWAANGQYRKLYDLLPPQQQKVLPYAKYHGCWVSAAKFGREAGVDSKSMKFVSAKVQPKTEPMTLSGTNVKVDATVVITTLSIVLRGQRTTMNVPGYWIEVDGKWRNIDHGVGDYKKPNCGISR